MATGIIVSIDDFGDGGVIQQDSDGSNINFQGAPPDGAGVGSRVSYDIDNSVNPPIAVNLVYPANDEPADEGTVRSGETISGNLDVPAGSTVTLKGCTVNGNVSVKGKLIVKTNSIINGEIDVRNGASELQFYNSSVTQTGIFFRNSSADCVISGGNVTGDVDLRNSVNVQMTGGGVTGDVDLRNNTGLAKIDGATIDGYVDIRHNAQASITGTHITGDLDMVNNSSCTNSGNTVDGTNNGC